MFQAEIRSVDNYLQNHFAQRFGELKLSPLKALRESVQYSVFSGGKRFRPLLCLLTAEALGRPHTEVLPLAASVELIHTYSLIHDDLPSMDNDDFRRGKPTNHKVFGETTALLAGDGLLTEAFFVIAQGYASRPAVGLQLTELVAQSSGLNGMVGGQALDLNLPKQAIQAEDLNWVHRLKTGALIAVSMEGAAVVCEADEKTQARLLEFGRQLGLAFQLADDLEDYNPQKPEASGFPTLLGPKKTYELLQEATRSALTCLEPDGVRAQKLRQITGFNLERVTKP